MSYKAKVYKVFIASPSDVTNEREIVRLVLFKWNVLNSETLQTVLLPIGWDTHSAPETGRSAQEYINEEILDKCDILIGVFWTKVGSPTKNHISGSVEEIHRHLSKRKLAMLYFSKKPIPSDADLEQIQKVRSLKEQYKNDSLYGEYSNESDLESKLYDHIQIKIKEGKFKPTFDSDILSRIDDDNRLAEEIRDYFPTVSMNLLKLIVDEKRSNLVWDSIVEQLTKSPVELRESLVFLAYKGAFKHRVFQKGYIALAKCSQSDFGLFIQSLYSINKYEFYDIYNQGLLEDSPFAKKLVELIRKQERNL